MSVPFRKRLQRYLNSNVDTLFTIPAFKTALAQGLSLNSSRTRSIFGIAASDELTAIAAGTALATFVAPNNMMIHNVGVSLTTAQVSGSDFTVDIKVNGVSILTDLLVIANTEEFNLNNKIESRKASLNAGDKITIDVTQIGDGTATGLKVYLNVLL